MRDRIDLNAPMPRYWEPKPSRFWISVCAPLHWLWKRHHRIARIDIDGMEKLSQLDPADGVLICPNHSYTGDGSVVMELARRAPRTCCIMAAWHVFRGHGGIDGWLLQRNGLFSVDREGCDRRAIRTASELLSTGRGLIIFPEGEIYHLNERLTPLREGVAFIALSAQKDLAKSNSPAGVWLVPAAIRYRFVGDVTRSIETMLTRMEQRLMLKPRPGTPLHERIINLGEVLLTIKEKEHLGRSFETEGDLPSRIARLTQHLLARREHEHLGKPFSGEPVPVRVKQLRRNLVEQICDESGNVQVTPELRDALADVHLALQLFSYPGDYIAAQPTPLRMAETVEKFEEDLYGVEATPIGWRAARVILGEPIDVRPFVGGKSRSAATQLTSRLEQDLQQLMQQH